MFSGSPDFQMFFSSRSSSLFILLKNKRNLAPPPTISRCIPTILGLRTNSQVVKKTRHLSASNHSSKGIQAPLEVGWLPLPLQGFCQLKTMGDLKAGGKNHHHFSTNQPNQFIGDSTSSTAEFFFG